MRNGHLRLAAHCIIAAVVVAMLAAAGQWFFDVGPWRDLIEHARCWRGRSLLIWGTAVADGFIALAYYAIPIELWWLTRKGQLPYPGLTALAGAFIFACGSTHVMDLWTIWVPNYYAAAVVKWLTAFVSCLFAILVGVGCWRLRHAAAPLSETIRQAADAIRPSDPALADVCMHIAEIVGGLAGARDEEI